MTLTAGVRLGSYEVITAIGAGGMGEVYRARDSKLHRDVALKILPDVFALDPDRLGRFQREAQVLASLNHPNIAAIYGLEETQNVHALVLELVEGPTLADRLTQGAIPLDEALPIARQIADALEAAHGQGVIHRDLKPANIKLRLDGAVKVLDFGLAKLADPSASGAGKASASAASMSPTLTSPAGTMAGVILGTAAYMSPEQARGKTVDKRADVWAFGVVLYEMLTGTRAFGGSEISDTLAGILLREPDWSVLPIQTPDAIRRLLRRCLEKDAKERLPEIGSARLELKEALTTPPVAATAVAPNAAMLHPAWRRTAVIAGTAIAAAALAGATVWFTMRPRAAAVARVSIPLPAAAAVAGSANDRDLTITPDGTRIVYLGANGQVYVRAMDQLEPKPLARVTGARGPFVSPDGQWIGYFAGSELKKVPITGGPPITLCLADSGGRGADWGPDGTIVFATQNTASGLWRVSAGGGAPSLLTKPDRQRGEFDHLWPEFLPNGQAVLFTITTAGSIDNAEVAVLDLKTGSQKILIQGGSHAHYLPSGHLVYGVAGTLRAVAFNPDQLEATSTPVVVLPQVVTGQFGAASFDVARDGTLVYLPGASQVRRLMWVDRQGHEELIDGPPRAYNYPRFSPDGTLVALDVRDPQGDIWIWGVTDGRLTRLTLDPSSDRFPVWTPDGRRLVFTSDRAGGNSNLYWQPADGTGAAERLVEGPDQQVPTSMSPDGSQLVFREQAGSMDLMLLSLNERRGVQPLVKTSFTEQNGEISHNGRWFAYESNDSGQFEIYVRPFPDTNSGHWQVSTAGGIQPLWAPNGRELFYVAPTGAMMSVPVGSGAAWNVGTPVKLFDGNYFLGPGPAAGTGRNYDISPDGRRFLMIKQGGGESDQTSLPASVIVVFNWFEELKRLVPTKR